MYTRKIKTRDQLNSLCKEWREDDLTIGFTSGAFDLIHAGHIDYLNEAKKNCDILIVGINSDASVQRYKGKNRPIIPAEQRVKIVASLEVVDYVFLFDERRNQANIEALQPHYYIKAGDYNIDQLTSKQTAAAYGGEVLLIPIKTPISTSKMIQKIQSLSAAETDAVIEYERAVYFPIKETKSKPVIFLDRDGTINADIEYLHEPEKFELLPNALQGLKKLQDMDYRLIIITTQAGIGLGYFTKENFYRVNREMFRKLSVEHITIDKIYFCPHNVTEDCPCRKPKTTLVDQARKDLNIDMDHSYFIGDQTTDIQTGVNAGLKTILVKTGKSGKDNQYNIKPDYVANDLLDAANWILANERKKE